MFLTILLVVLGIALGVVYFNREKDEDKARIGIVALTAAIVVVSILRLIGVGGGGSGVVYDVTADRSVGEVFADRIVQSAEGKRVVIVADVDTKNPFLAARQEAFRARLLTHNMEVLATETPWPQSILGPDETFPGEGVDARALEEALRLHPDAEVLVSLAGFPAHNLAEAARNLAGVEFYVFDESVSSNWSDAVEAGVVDGMVVQMYDADWSDTSGSGEELFDRRYAIVTSENLEEVRQRLGLVDETTW